MAVSTIALIELSMLDSFRRSDQPPGPILLEQLLPETTLHERPLNNEWSQHYQPLHHRTSEVRICLLAELLDHCAGDPEHLPFKLSQTIRRLGNSAPLGRVHPDHQLAFSRALHHLSIGPVSLPNSALISIIEDLMACELFFYYRIKAPDLPPGLEEEDLVLWVDNSDALNEILEVFNGVDNTFPPGDMHRRLNLVMRTMELQKARCRPQTG
ncbi:hypothetical protein C8F01DRAFT_1156997 [Mycena amicta]|nr:hypothetical protein C8F01DRAFT_1156997 [Mycena amicta]